MSGDSSRRQILGREGALLVLFGMDLTGYAADEALDLTYSVVERADAEIAEEWELVEWRVRGVDDGGEEVDEEIQNVSPRWRIERMGIVDRNILRVGAWEVLESEIPAIVTIDACVELAKTYGEQDTPGFVNGLLDELCSVRGIEVA